MALTPRQYYNLLPSQRQILASVVSALGVEPDDFFITATATTTAVCVDCTATYLYCSLYASAWRAHTTDRPSDASPAWFCSRARSSASTSPDTRPSTSATGSRADWRNIWPCPAHSGPRPHLRAHASAKADTWGSVGADSAAGHCCWRALRAVSAAPWWPCAHHYDTTYTGGRRRRAFSGFPPAFACRAYGRASSIAARPTA